LTLGLKYVHVHSMRLQTGQEALVARVLTLEGKTCLGFSFRLDAAEARQMAEWDAGTGVARPRYEPVLGPPKRGGKGRCARHYDAGSVRRHRPDDGPCAR
jgi:hypothetical protein